MVCQIHFLSARCDPYANWGCVNGTRRHRIKGSVLMSYQQKQGQAVKPQLKLLWLHFEDRITSVCYSALTCWPSCRINTETGCKPISWVRNLWFIETSITCSMFKSTCKTSSHYSLTLAVLHSSKVVLRYFKWKEYELIKWAHVGSLIMLQTWAVYLAYTPAEALTITLWAPILLHL